MFIERPIPLGPPRPRSGRMFIARPIFCCLTGPRRGPMFIQQSIFDPYGVGGYPEVSVCYKHSTPSGSAAIRRSWFIISISISHETLGGQMFIPRPIHFDHPQPRRGRMFVARPLHCDLPGPRRGPMFIEKNN